jgi:hypothetical protein
MTAGTGIDCVPVPRFLARFIPAEKLVKSVVDNTIPPAPVLQPHAAGRPNAIGTTAMPTISRRTWLGCAAATVLPVASPQADGKDAAGGLRPLLEGLLRDWCGGLVRQQVIAPAQPAVHGSFRCPACGEPHGRSGEAVLPLLQMAEVSADVRYLDAAVAAVAWMRNVDAPDGAWTNELDPKSWKGTTVFGATALAEAVSRHGRLLDAGVRSAWLARLRRAADFIRDTVTPDYGNANYAAAASHCLWLTGTLLDDARLRARGRDLARASIARLSEPSRLFFGEGRPADRRSAKGCPPVDLGYNVEESLPTLAAYALAAGDREVLDAVVGSLRSHVAFMLPDGAWDNSWGTRNAKWTYWGSRTADGCTAALLELAEHDPAFAAAATRNARLLRDCTHEGLLHGGPHLASHGLPPCIHHTFCHAKAIAGAVHMGARLDAIDIAARLPRESQQGLRRFPEIDVVLAAAGPWRATVTGYDWLYKAGVFQPSGGSLSLLWHETVGPVFAGSMTIYRLVEPHNMRPGADGEDVPLTPRVEIRAEDGIWLTNLFDRRATITHAAEEGRVVVAVEARLENEAADADDPPAIRIRYAIDSGTFEIAATGLPPTARLVLPVIARGDEELGQPEPGRVIVAKRSGTLVLETNGRCRRIPTAGPRIFNHVPGFEAVPFEIPPDPTGTAVARLRVHG